MIDIQLDRDWGEYMRRLRAAGQDAQPFLRSTIALSTEALHRTLTEHTSGFKHPTGNLQRSWKRGAIMEGLMSATQATENDAKNAHNGANYASFVNYGHVNTHKTRWVPGVWVGDWFQYIPGKKPGMLLRPTKWVPGYFFQQTAEMEFGETWGPLLEREFTGFFVRHGIADRG